MSDTTLTPDSAADQARKILEADVDKRVDAVRVAATAAVQVETTEQQLKDAAASYDAAFKAAVNAGWTAKDLKAAGLRSPSPATPRTRRRRNAAGELVSEPSA